MCHGVRVCVTVCDYVSQCAFMCHSHRWARVLGQGGVYTLGVSEKNFAAASGGRNTWV